MENKSCQIKFELIVLKTAMTLHLIPNWMEHKETRRSQLEPFIRLRFSLQCLFEKFLMRKTSRSCFQQSFACRFSFLHSSNFKKRKNRKKFFFETKVFLFAKNWGGLNIFYLEKVIYFFPTNQIGFFLLKHWFLPLFSLRSENTYIDSFS